MTFLEPEKQLSGRPLSGANYTAAPKNGGGGGGGSRTAVAETVFGPEEPAVRYPAAGSPASGSNHTAAEMEEDDGFELPIALMLAKRPGTARAEATRRRSLAEESQAPPAEAVPLSETPAWLYTHRMLYPFTASGANQLSCAAGAPVKVLFRQSAEWWDVEQGPNGLHGIVPSSYLAEDTPVATPAPSGAAAAAAHTTGSAVAAASSRAHQPQTVAAVEAAKPAPHDPFAPTAATHYVSFEYTASGPTEVSAARGQHVQLVSQTGEWSKIKLLSSGQEGYIPGSFLKGISTAPPPLAASPAAAAPAAAAIPAAAAAAPAAPAAAAGPQGQAVDAGEMHVSEHDWHGTHATHISFSAGDFIRVVNKDLGGGWWKGSCVVSPGHPTSDTGLFPGSYCREATPEEKEAIQTLQGAGSEPEAAPALAPAPPAPVAKARPLSIAAAPKRNGALAPPPVAKARPLSFVATSIPSVAKVIALFEYEPVKDDELSFVEGDHVDVTQMNDDGWFAGFVLRADGTRGDFGFFPENYVEQMAASEA